MLMTKPVRSTSEGGYSVTSLQDRINADLETSYKWDIQAGHLFYCEVGFAENPTKEEQIIKEFSRSRTYKFRNKQQGSDHSW